MRGGGIPSGLTALLMKLGMVQKGPGGPGGPVKGEAKGLEGETKDAAKAEKGALLGQEGALLAGLGYNIKDHRTSAKNVAEQANLERFLHEMEGQPKELGAKKGEEGPQGLKKGAEGKEAREGREGKETQAEARGPERARDKAEDGRVQGQAEAKEAAEARRETEAKETEGQGQHKQQQDDQQDQDDKPGGAWIPEELEGQEISSKRGLRASDSLGEAHRCSGTLDDGTRCLRKPVKGTPYCREHFVPIVPPRQA